MNDIDSLGWLTQTVERIADHRTAPAFAGSRSMFKGRHFDRSAILPCVVVLLAAAPGVSKFTRT